MIKKYNQYIKESFDEELDYEEEEDYDNSEFITDDEFKQFLIDNDCLDKYIYNYERGEDFREKSMTGYKMFKNKDDITLIDKMNYIIFAFNWGEAPEGDEFWNKIFHKWRKKIGVDWEKDKYIKENIDDEFYEYEDEEDFDDSFITDDEFRQFLIDNNCLDKYIYNYKRFKYHKKDIFLSNDRFKFLLKAFNWDETPEGGDFWDLLDDLWEKEIRGYSEWD